jgi:[protein-PII] uridylyltransferase
METLSQLSSRLSGARPEERVALMKSLRSEIREEAARRLARGGLAACHFLSDRLDELVFALYQSAVREGKVGVPVALVATGGWGRREVCPYSDLDLLFLTTRAPDDAVRELADRVLYPLWDSGLDVGHAVRSIEETMELARGDLPTVTALFDARLVAGDVGVSTDLIEALEGKVVRTSDPNQFIARLMEEKRNRHAKFGDTLFLLEPNLKHGQGAQRDLATGLWAARARWGVHDFGDLVPIGQGSVRQVTTLAQAREFILRVRTALHLSAGRRLDQLTFEMQEAIAPAMYPDAKIREGEVRPAVAPAVEELMRRYYLHAKAVVRETDRLLERALVPAHRRPTIRRVDASFTAFNGQLSTADPAILREKPSEIVRIFQVALVENLPIYGHTRELLMELVAERGAALGADAVARRLFVEILTDPRDTRQPSILEEMHDLGILAALMPEFAPCTGRVQHDLYHVYTVDQHQLYAVALLKRIARGELAKEAPTATEACAKISRHAALYLGTLLHDVGKPLGKGHSEKGAKIAVAIARRLGLSPEDVHQTEFLVKQHLLMSHLSQRRDLHDISLIANFAETMRDEETLREMYLLTYCDAAMTAPGNLNEWKAMLLAELYDRTRSYFKRGPDLLGAEAAVLVQKRKKRVGELLGESIDDGPLAAWLEGLPDRYLTQLAARSIAEHVRLSRHRKELPVALKVAHHPRKGYSEVALVASDAPGLLFRTAGVMLANRIDVLGAQINSRTPRTQGETCEALDLFFVRDRYGRAIPQSDARWPRVEADLLAVLGGEVEVEELICARREKSGLGRRVTPEVPTEIEIDNDVAADFTVIDVYTHDRLGILYAITRTLTKLSLDIFLSKVATEANRVADVFYVRDRKTGAKIEDPGRLVTIAVELRSALGEIDG